MAVLMYTSGTSGLPKGVPLTFGNLQSDVDAAIAYMDFQTRHKFLGIIPLFHVFGMIAMMLAADPTGSDGSLYGAIQPARRGEGDQRAWDIAGAGRAKHVRGHGPAQRSLG